MSRFFWFTVYTVFQRKKTGPFVNSSYLSFDSYELNANFLKYIGVVACCEYGITFVTDWLFFANNIAKCLLRGHVTGPLSLEIASCLIHGQPFRHTSSSRPTPISLTACTHFGAPLGAFFYLTGCFENNVPFDNTGQIYLINLHWKLGLGFKLRLRVALF